MVNSRGITGRIALNVARLAARVFPRSNAVRRAYHGVRNWYEAGWPMTGEDRAYVPGLVQDARWDGNYVTRREMLRRMRYWSQNSPLLESILSVGERYTVGPAGLHVSFHPCGDASYTADDQDPWYEAAEHVVKEWFADCGRNGEAMETLLKVGYRCQNVDGDVFMVKTSKRAPLQVGKQTVTVSRPCIQLVEGHRIETPFNKWQDEGQNIIDGVQFQTVKSNGRDMMEPVGYWIRNGFGAFETESSWFLIPRDAVIHVFQPHRVNQYRGLSAFYSCENELAKLEELLKLEFQAQIEQSKRAVKIENAAGQIPKVENQIAARLGVNRPAGSSTAESNAWLQTARQYYEKVYNAFTYAVRLGEKVEFHSPTRPSESTLQLWEYLVNSVCAGGHAPRCLVFEKISGSSAGYQGTAVRAELDAADEFYRGDFQKWKRAVREAVVFFMEWAVRNDPRVADPPADWRHCIHIQQPEGCNVDIGWNAQANVMELAAGVTNWDILYGRRGMNARTELRKLARFQRLIEKEGVKISLPALLAGQINLSDENSRPTKDQEVIHAG